MKQNELRYFHKIMKVKRADVKKLNAEFYQKAEPIISHPNYQKQKNISHHHHSTIYNHVIEVSRICYIIAKKHEGTSNPYDIDALLKAALLHDYFLYNWRYTDDREKPHLFKHPSIAIRNAKKDFGLTEKEESIIYTHMWPFTFLRFPKYREGWLLSWIDKYVSFKDFLHKNLTDIKDKIEEITSYGEKEKDE